MGRDPGAWIAIGVSVLFIIVGFVMHRIFVNVLQNRRQTADLPTCSADSAVCDANPTGFP
jgi:peptidoglycan/LPS O-acetylase OafA/YrhL